MEIDLSVSKLPPDWDSTCYEVRSILECAIREVPKAGVVWNPQHQKWMHTFKWNAPALGERAAESAKLPLWSEVACKISTLPEEPEHRVSQFVQLSDSK